MRKQKKTKGIVAVLYPKSIKFRQRRLRQHKIACKRLNYNGSILSLLPSLYDDSTHYFFDTDIQSNVESGMLMLGWGCSDYYLSYAHLEVNNGK